MYFSPAGRRERLVRPVAACFRRRPDRLRAARSAKPRCRREAPSIDESELVQHLPPSCISSARASSIDPVIARRVATYPGRIPSEWRSPGTCSIICSHRSIASVTGVGSEHGRDSVCRCSAALLPLVPGASGLLERMLLRLGGEAEVAGGPGSRRAASNLWRDPRDPRPARRQPSLRRSSPRLRRASSPCRLPSAVRGAGRGRHGRTGAERRQRWRSLRRGPIRLPRTARPGSTPRRVREELEAAGSSAGRSATARPSRFAAAGMSPRTNARRPADASRAGAAAPSARACSSSGPSSIR